MAANSNNRRWQGVCGVTFYGPSGWYRPWRNNSVPTHVREIATVASQPRGESCHMPATWTVRIHHLPPQYSPKSLKNIMNFASESRTQWNTLFYDFTQSVPNQTSLYFARAVTSNKLGTINVFTVVKITITALSRTFTLCGCRGSFYRLIYPQPRLDWSLI